IVQTDSHYGFKRSFYNIYTTEGSEKVIFSGKYKANENDILEMKVTSKKKEYFIVHNKEVVRLCDEDNADIVTAIKRYLDKDLELLTLLEISGVEEVNDEVLDELKD